MSVALFSKERINSLENTLATNDTESRAIWYGYVANLTAYNAASWSEATRRRRFNRSSGQPQLSSMVDESLEQNVRKNGNCVYMMSEKLCSPGLFSHFNQIRGPVRVLLV